MAYTFAARLYFRPYAEIGLGKMLLEEVESFAVSWQSARLFLITTPFLHAAIHLYEDFGFRRTSEPPHDLFNTPLFTMEKKL